MYHFVWANQREKQGYKSDVSQKAGIQLVASWEIYKPETHAALYIDSPTDYGFKFVNISKVNSWY